MRVAIVLLNRDLRVRDQPALAAACGTAERVVPLFVFDPAALTGLHAAPNRARFLVEALSDLRASLRRRGGDLVLRHGDPVTEALALAAETGAPDLHAGADVSRYARTRERRLAEACGRERRRLHLHEGATIVPPGRLRPASGDHYRVFTPYWRAWSGADRRDTLPAPAAVRLPPRLRVGAMPRPEALVPGAVAPELAPGGESAAGERLEAWAAGELAGYDENHDDLAGDRTSRLSPYLHFGCLSPLLLAERVAQLPGAEPFLRQLAWRDFHHQVNAAFPDITRRDYRPRGDRWRRDEEAYAAWREGRTGYPIVDAGMRQLAREGWMHNRARLIVGSFLTKHLYLDWRLGAAHFMELLLDGDVANNYGNWQWVAGTGNDTRPNRVLNPLRQARRFDADGSYVRRYVPELSGLTGPEVHAPWRLPERVRRGLSYPEPIVDPDEPPAMAAARAAGTARGGRAPTTTRASGPGRVGRGAGPTRPGRRTGAGSR